MFLVVFCRISKVFCYVVDNILLSAVENSAVVWKTCGKTFPKRCEKILCSIFCGGVSEKTQNTLRCRIVFFAGLGKRNQKPVEKWVENSPINFFRRYQQEFSTTC
jgi:hypothetical protein